jgi:hypothetical protein
MDEITSSVVLPVTDAQMAAFSAWVIESYVTYDGFMAAIKSPEIDTYIKTHILPQEMNTVLRRSQPYIGEKWGDVTIQTLLLYRRRVTAKMKNLKDKIGTMTFPIESAQTRRVLRIAATTRRLDRESEQLRYEQQMQAFREREIRDSRHAKGLPFPEIKLPIIVTLSEEDAKTCVMDDDCVICLAQHKMTDACTINCGHQFGQLCLAKWKKDTCPLCRTKITETTVFAVPIALLLTEDDVAVLV